MKYGVRKYTLTNNFVLMSYYRAGGGMVYTKDLKSFALKACGFDSHPAHQEKIPHLLREFFLTGNPILANVKQ